MSWEYILLGILFLLLIYILIKARFEADKINAEGKKKK